MPYIACGEHKKLLNEMDIIPIIYVVPILFFTAFVFIRRNFTSSKTHKKLPPSLPKLPVLGNFHQIGRFPHRSLCSLAQRHGPLMLLHFGGVPVVVVSSSDAAREMMKTHDIFFSERPRSTIAERIFYDRKDISTAPYGEYWRQMRSICVLQILSNKRVQSFRTVREEEVAFYLKEIEGRASSSLPVNLSEMFSSLTSDVICRAAFGRKYNLNDSGRKFNELLREFMALLGGFNVGDFIPWLGWLNTVTGCNAKVEKISKEFDEFLDVIVEEHLHGQNRETVHGDGNADSEAQKDFVDVLLEIQKKNLAGFSLDTVSIKALILDMFAGGTDSTYAVLEWAMTELLRHPRVMQKLQNEVRQIANNKPFITEDDLDKMHYMKAVFKEILRLYPPLPLLVRRVITQDVIIKGYDISAGTVVMINIWAIARDPKTWVEPDKFWPERFLNNSVDFKGHDFELIPFGAGRRGCPGMSFSMAIDELVLANIVHKYDWSLPAGTSVEDLDVTECISLTMHKKVPLLAVATPVSA